MRSNNRSFDSRGKLVVVEGIDGSGKSTQIRLLEKWLISKGMRVFLTEWNSSELVKEITSKGKKKGRLTPTTFCLLHATDFADRYERNIFPLVHAGYIVLADRYVYTAYARDIVRGCDPRWDPGEGLESSQFSSIQCSTVGRATQTRLLYKIRRIDYSAKKIGELLP